MSFELGIGIWVGGAVIIGVVAIVAHAWYGWSAMWGPGSDLIVLTPVWPIALPFVALHYGLKALKARRSRRPRTIAQTPPDPYRVAADREVDAILGERS